MVDSNLHREKILPSEKAFAYKMKFDAIDSFTDKITDDYLDETKQLLMGKYGFMCQYEDPNFETVWSSIFDLESLMIYRAEGDPRKKRFILDIGYTILSLGGNTSLDK